LTTANGPFIYCLFLDWWVCFTVDIWQPCC
jgi:hypothetical protein